MKVPLIGVLGCGGAVGSVASNFLQQTYRIRGGQRHPPEKSSEKNSFEWMKMDLYNSESLSDFCAGCDVILNCAGPSYRIGDRVALAANEAGASYVDVFGADPLEQSLSEKIHDIGGLFVISAGAFPGLSGVLPRWLFSQGFETIDSIYAFAGGREHCSINAGADLLLSSVAGFGIPEAYWNNSSVARYSEYFPKEIQLRGFGEVYVQPFLHTETIRLAKQLKLNQAHWYNVIVDKQIYDTFLKCCARMSVDGSNAVLEKSVSELVNVASVVSTGRTHWYNMMVDVQGTKQEKIIKKRAILRSSSSYQLSGVVAASTVQIVLEQRPSDGIYWAFEVLEPGVLIDQLLATKAAESLDVVEIPSLNKDIFPEKIEKGEI